jgi:hypothetical protein
MSTVKPSRQLARALAAHERAELQLAVARAELHTAIAEELRAGVRQAELVELTGYSREHIRRIARDAGLPAA